MSHAEQLPPHDSSAETGALGCCLCDPGLIGNLKLDRFYDIRNRFVAEFLLSMAKAGKPVSTLTLANEIISAGKVEDAGGIGFLSTLEEQTPSALNFPYFQSILEDCFTLRKILATSAETSTRCHEAGARDYAQTILGEFQNAAIAIGQAQEATPTISALVMQGIDALETAIQERGKLRGIPSGFPDLDRLTNGFRPGQLIVIAARPAIGKTSLAMNIVEHCAVDGAIPVGVFSLEMSALELTLRMQCCRARVDQMASARGELSEQDIAKIGFASKAIKSAPIFIDDRGGLTIGQLGASARRMRQIQKIQLLVIDYMGLLRCGEKRQNRYEETSLISNALKALAKELCIPIIALCQLSRSCDNEARAPRLSDLRDSGSIEQDADFVGLLHAGDGAAGDIVPITLIVAKQRSGPVGTVNLQFWKKTTRFESVAQARYGEAA